ncbi:hypothetical protein GCM10008932_05180 [Alkalibacterium iburiense]|uniref:Cell wall hydrolase SleB domain-containing protein n=1 Tax=Alkalibacterium iburiense TaxID=290589 RepID=A0ABN0X4S7_9LACT
MNFKKLLIISFILGGIIFRTDSIKAESLSLTDVFQSLGILSNYEPKGMLDLVYLELIEEENSVETVLDEPVEEVAVSTSKRSEDESVDAEKLDLLARIIEAEAKGESYEGKLAVGQVVLNRVKHNQFPDTIYDVIYQPRQFEPVMNGTFYNEATEESIQAAYEVLRQDEPIIDALYFYNPTIAANQDWFDTLEFVDEIGNHVFRR